MHSFTNQGTSLGDWEPLFEKHKITGNLDSSNCLRCMTGTISLTHIGSIVTNTVKVITTVFSSSSSHCHSLLS